MTEYFEVFDDASVGKIMCVSNSVIRLGYFWKILVTFFREKVAQSICQLFGLFWSLHIKTAVAASTFLADVWNNWATFKTII